MGRLPILELLILVWAIASTSAASRDYDSIIKAGVHTSYWGVTNDQCTSVHAVNVTTGGLQWRRNPVGEEQTWSVATERRAFFTIRSGPQVSAVSLDSGSLKWSWPPRTGHVWDRRWQTDLSQHARLADPLPALQAQTLIVRAEEDSKVIALDLVTGNLTWEFDALSLITQAAASASLGDPKRLLVTAWELEGPGSLYVAFTALHAAAPPIEPPGPSSKPTRVRGWLPDSWHPSQWWPSGWWPFNSNSSGSDGDLVSRGWVLALDVVSGAVVWTSAPLDLPPANLVLSEPTLLVASQPNDDGTGSLYGLDKDTGVLEYTLPCDSGPCPVQVTDTRVGLLTTGLTHNPPNLTQLSAFDLGTGTWLWRGLPSSSQLASYAVDACTNIAATRPHLYFACTCSENASTHSGPSWRAESVPNSALEAAYANMHHLIESESGGGGVLGTQEGEGADIIKPKPRPKPRPPPPPQPTGLCAFAVSAVTGKIGYEVVLSATDSVPSNASLYRYAPLVMADSVVFRGRLGVYALPTVDAAVLTTASAHQSMQTQPMHASEDISMASPKARFTFELPLGLESQSWDWLELKAGRLLLQVSVPKQSDDSDNRVWLSRLWRGIKRLITPKWASVGGEDLPLASTWLFALDASNGSVYWSLATNMSLGPRTPRTTPHEWARGGLLLVDGCRPPLDETSAADAAGGPRPAGRNLDARMGSVRNKDSSVPSEGEAELPGEDMGAGTSCCLFAVSVDTGSVAWRHCFDLDRACASGVSRRTATSIVYSLLACLVIVAVLGCILHGVCLRRARLAAEQGMLSVMDDPDSEYESLLVAVPGAPGITQPDHRHAESDSD